MLRNITPQIWPWIYHNPTLELISMSDDGTNWTTMSDRNLWATEYLWESATESNSYWDYYYWGSQSPIATSTWNEEDWQESDTGSSQTPATSWFHIPSLTDWMTALTIWDNLWAWVSWWNRPWDDAKTYMLLPYAGLWDSDSSQYSYIGTAWYYWASSWYNQYPWSISYNLSINSSRFSPYNTIYVRMWTPLRLFKIAPVVPDSTRTVLYQPSS